MPRIKVLHSMSAWGGGHVQTCINILKGMVAAGGDVHLEVPRTRVDMGQVPHRASLRWPLSRFVMPRYEEAFKERAAARFLADLRPDDIAWIWPAAPVSVYREVARRGNPILMEGINTRIANARRILEPIHAAEGVAPPFDMTRELPEAEEEEMLALASYFYAPNPKVVEALEAEDSAFRGTVLPTSYGTWVADGRPVDRSGRDGPVKVLFVGTVCLRKNAHGLLRAWAKLAPKNAQLILCGGIEAHVAKVCAQELALPSVDARGQVRGVNAAYAEADVFVMPSFEEGGPQVTFEAASFGLPVIASPMGDGGMSARSDAVWPIDPYDIDSMVEALAAFIDDAERRAEYGARALQAVPQFDWNVVGRDRLEALQAAFIPFRRRRCSVSIRPGWTPSPARVLSTPAGRE